MQHAGPGPRQACQNEQACKQHGDSGTLHKIFVEYYGNGKNRIILAREKPPKEKMLSAFLNTILSRVQLITQTALICQFEQRQGSVAGCRKGLTWTLRRKRHGARSCPAAMAQCLKSLSTWLFIRGASPLSKSSRAISATLVTTWRKFLKSLTVLGMATGCVRGLSLWEQVSDEALPVPFFLESA